MLLSGDENGCKAAVVDVVDAVAAVSSSVGCKEEDTSVVVSLFTGGGSRLEERFLGDAGDEEEVDFVAAAVHVVLPPALPKELVPEEE